MAERDDEGPPNRRLSSNSSKPRQQEMPTNRKKLAEHAATTNQPRTVSLGSRECIPIQADNNKRSIMSQKPQFRTKRLLLYHFTTTFAWYLPFLANRCGLLNCVFCLLLIFGRCWCYSRCFKFFHIVNSSSYFHQT